MPLAGKGILSPSAASLLFQRFNRLGWIPKFRAASVVQSNKSSGCDITAPLILIVRPSNPLAFLVFYASPFTAAFSSPLISCSACSRAGRWGASSWRRSGTRLWAPSAPPRVLQRGEQVAHVLLGHVEGDALGDLLKFDHREVIQSAARWDLLEPVRQLRCFLEGRWTAGFETENSGRM